MNVFHFCTVYFPLSQGNEGMHQQQGTIFYYRQSFLLRNVRRYKSLDQISTNKPSHILWTAVYITANNQPITYNNACCSLTNSLMKQQRLSVSGVTRVGVTRGGNWRRRPYLFLKTPTTFFWVIALCKVMTFFSCRLITTPIFPQFSF